jgi:xanthine dehydrogenase accessory factor
VNDDAILRAAESLRARAEPFLLATVMHVSGSAYRRPGARMLCSETHWLAGSISGGCLEADVVKRGFFRTREQPAVLVRYDASADDDATSGYGLGCDGVVEVLLERIAEATRCDPLAFIAHCRASQTRGVIATVFHCEDAPARVGERLLLSADTGVRSSLQCGAERIARLAAEVLASGKTRSESLDAGRVRVLFELIEPPPQLFLFGAGHDVLPVASLAHALDWCVQVCERHPRVETRARFTGLARYAAGSGSELAALVERAARPLAVLMSHRYTFDRELLGALLASRRLRYLGVLGPVRRTQRMLVELEASGVDVRGPALRHLHAPVGLDLGAETPAEIALSVIAEAQACLADRAATRLRERAGAIHDHTSEQSPRRWPLTAAAAREPADASQRP